MAMDFAVAVPLLYGPKLRGKLKWIKVLFAVVGAEILLGSVADRLVHNMELQTRTRATEKMRITQTLEDLQAQLRALNEERAILVQTRSPELRPFEFDKAIPINEAYLENIRFARPWRGNAVSAHTHDYSVFMLARRQILDFTHCVVELSFFDRTGVQIDAHRIDPCSSAGPSVEKGISDLMVSFSFPLALAESIRPAYFAVEIRAGWEDR